MPSWRRLLLGLWLEVRVIPVLMWSYTAITLGTGVAWHDGPSWPLGYVAAIAVGVLLQGVVAHAANDVADWDSGTDRDPAPRMLSGGSRVIGAGILAPRELRILGVSAALAAAVIGALVAVERGPQVLVLGALGLGGALLYSLPPARAAYRPFAGEAVAFTCVTACAVGGELVARGSVTATGLVAGLAYAASCVGMLLMHHYLDRGPDSRALPPKRTSIVYLEAGGRRLACAWAAAAAAIAGALAVASDGAFLVMAAAFLLALLCHLRVRPEDPASVTRAEIAVIGLSMAGGLGTAAVLSPALAWALLPPAIAVPIELRLSGLARRAALERHPLGAPAPETSP